MNNLETIKTTTTEVITNEQGTIERVVNDFFIPGQTAAKFAGKNTDVLLQKIGDNYAIISQNKNCITDDYAIAFAGKLALYGSIAKIDNDRDINFYFINTSQQTPVQPL